LVFDIVFEFKLSYCFKGTRKEDERYKGERAKGTRAKGRKENAGYKKHGTRDKERG
jgi:hypothetical protein